MERKDTAAYTRTDLGRDDGCSSRDRRAVETRGVERVSWRSPGDIENLVREDSKILASIGSGRVTPIRARRYAKGD